MYYDLNSYHNLVNNETTETPETSERLEAPETNQINEVSEFMNSNETHMLNSVTGLSKLKKLNCNDNISICKKCLLDVCYIALPITIFVGLFMTVLAASAL